MDLEAFATGGCRGVHVIKYSLTGGAHGGRSVVTDCTLEVEYENRQEEVEVRFGNNPPALETLLALIAALNRKLGN